MSAEIPKVVLRPAYEIGNYGQNPVAIIKAEGKFTFEEKKLEPKLQSEIEPRTFIPVS